MHNVFHIRNENSGYWSALTRLLSFINRYFTDLLTCAWKKKESKSNNKEWIDDVNDVPNFQIKQCAQQINNRVDTQNVKRIR